jgi:hypothetical protein
MWTTNIMRHSFVHQNLLTLMGNFRYDAHPMGVRPVVNSTHARNFSDKCSSFLPI